MSTGRPPVAAAAGRLEPKRVPPLECAFRLRRQLIGPPVGVPQQVPAGLRRRAAGGPARGDAAALGQEGELHRLTRSDFADEAVAAPVRTRAAGAAPQRELP